jgi:predicted GNAT family acetyltransferase
MSLLMAASAADTPRLNSKMAATLTTHALHEESEAEVLAFLAARPIHTVCLSGLIRDNGLVSPRNRGTFYACRDTNGQIEGVALIGHATLIETHSDSSLETFARLTQSYPRAHLIRGEQEKIERFWSFFAPQLSMPRLVCRELLLEQQQVSTYEQVEGLRLATLNDMEAIIAINARMIYEECNINPLANDPIGFRQRTARRVEQGRVWVVTRDEEILFKTDVISDTPEVIYLEGVYVNPSERGTGFGLNCFSQLCEALLLETRSLCLLVNDDNKRALNFYYKAGYMFRGYYDTIYLQQKSS